MLWLHFRRVNLNSWISENDITLIPIVPHSNWKWTDFIRVNPIKRILDTQRDTLQRSSKITVLYHTACYLMFIRFSQLHQHTLVSIPFNRNIPLMWFITMTSLLARWRLKSPVSRLFTQPFIQGADQRKHQSSALLAFEWGIHRSPVNSLHKGPVMRKMFPFEDVISKSKLLVTFGKQHLREADTKLVMLIIATHGQSYRLRISTKTHFGYVVGYVNMLNWKPCATWSSSGIQNWCDQNAFNRTIQLLNQQQWTFTCHSAVIFT